MRAQSRGRTLTAMLAVGAIGVMGLSATVGSNSARAADGYRIDAGQLTVSLDDSGRIVGLMSKIDGINHVQPDHVVPLIRILIDGSAQEPTALNVDPAGGSFELDFGAKDVQVEVAVRDRNDYATLEVSEITAPAGVDVEALLWGPIATDITKQVAETTGVVYDGDFAIGIHALNAKTIGGWPLDLDSAGYPGGPGPDRMDYHQGAASRTTWGSVLQAYSWDYTKDRTRTIGIPGVPNEYMPNQPVPALPGEEGRLTGSKIALFGAWRPNVLPTLEKIQLGEDLFHGTIDGKWQKTAQETTQSFLVLSDISAANISEAADYAIRGGMKNIYSLEGVSGPWNSDGHNVFKSKLGASDADVKKAVDIAAAKGVRYGAHTLSGFISANDPYVGPTPDPGLAKAGAAPLTRALDATSTDVYVSTDAPFRHATGDLIQIGDELITYRSIASVGEDEWRLSGGQRGAFGTARAAHEVGASAARLWKNQYGGVLAGHALVEPMSSRFAEAWNATGTRSMSFDGLEGLYESEYGPYDLTSYIENMLRSLDEPDGFLTEASSMSHNMWDLQSRVSWGESYTSSAQRAVNMSYMQRNFMPAMIGWLYLDYYGSAQALEQDLAKMAGWNAGAGFQTSVAAAPGKGAYLDRIRVWESARNAGAFTEDQRTRLRDANRLWKLDEIEKGKQWSLQEIDGTGKPLGAPEPVFPGNAAGSVNVALNHEVTFSGESIRPPAYATDGDATSANRTVGLEMKKPGWIQVDLGEAKNIDQIKLWHDWRKGGSYRDVVVQLSDDPTFPAAESVTVFNNDADGSLGLGAGDDPSYVETEAGRSIPVKSISARYARFWTSGTAAEKRAAWNEIQLFETPVVVPPENYAAGVIPTFSGPHAQSPAFATDGDIDSNAWVGLNDPGEGWMQLDLGKARKIGKIKLWQYWANGRTYHDVVVQLSDDPTFATGVTTVFNNDTDGSTGHGAGTDAEYAETSAGNTIPVDGVSARYVRFWANGSTSNPYDSWVETQVYGH